MDGQTDGHSAECADLEGVAMSVPLKEPMTDQECRDILRRRITWLQTRIAYAQAQGREFSYDKAELSAIMRACEALERSVL